MVVPLLADRTRKEEFFEMLDETIRTNPYRKAATAMVSVMSKHGIESTTGSSLGRPPHSASEKKCALSRSLKLAQNCNQKLNMIKEDLQALCSDFGKAGAKIPIPPSSGGDMNGNPGTSMSADGLPDKATMTGHLLTLIGEAEMIAKRIYETAVGLHITEDYLRQPEDLKLLDFSPSGRIQIPNYSFNHASQLCLEWLHATALKWLRGFKEQGDEDNAQFIKIFENFTKAVKDFTEAVCLANQVFRVLLYPNAQGKECLQEYIQSLGHVLKNDIIMEIQSLRRTFDNIQYCFERLGWSASIAWTKYSGKNITVETLNENGIQVDRSRFQYKFYEGPQRSKGKKKDSNQSSKKGKTLKVKKGYHGIKTVKKSSDSPLSAAQMEHSSAPGTSTEPNQNTPGPAGDEKDNSHASSAKKKLEEARNPTEEASSPMTRKSRSTSDILKTRKVVKKKVKAKKIKAKEIIEAPVAPAPSENQVSFSVGDNRQSIMKILTNEKSSSLSIGSSSPAKRSTQALIPPPKIPWALRQQFNAVFGTQVLPIKAVKPLKKKMSNAAAAASNAKVVVEENRSQ